MDREKPREKVRVVKAEMVQMAVEKGILTEDDAREIMGEVKG